MELETETSSYTTFGQSQHQKLNPNDYYSNYTVTNGQDLSKFQQYNTPFQAFLSNNNMNYPQQQCFSSASTQSNQQSINFANYQQQSCFQNNTFKQHMENGSNIFAQQAVNMNQQFQAPSVQVGVNIFAQNNMNQNVNVFNGNQNIFATNGQSFNQMANNIFPQVEVDMNKFNFVQEPQEQEDEGDADYDPAENEEGEDIEKQQENDDNSSSGTSCDEDDPNEIEDCINGVDERNFNLQEYLSVRDQL